MISINDPLIQELKEDYMDSDETALLATAEAAINKGETKIATYSLMFARVVMKNKNEFSKMYLYRLLMEKLYSLHEATTIKKETLPQEYKEVQKEKRKEMYARLKEKRKEYMNSPAMKARIEEMRGRAKIMRKDAYIKMKRRMTRS